MKYMKIRNVKKTENLIRLDIVADYPVNWSFEKVAVDLIQNFYDSIGEDRFAECFRIETIRNANNDNCLKMYGKSCSFHYEWLTGIGNSTKYDKQMAGLYGEGFKLCVLMMAREDRIAVTMESESWSLTPVFYEDIIDGETITMMGYLLNERKDDGITVLTLEHLSDREVREIELARQWFIYSDNPLVGTCLVKKENYSVFERNNTAFYHYGMPRSDLGILFCNHMARGILPFPLILHFKEDRRGYDTRTRRILSSKEVRITVLRMARCMEAEDALCLLNRLKHYWSELPRRIVDGDTWYYVICELVRRVSSEEGAKAKFEAENELYYVDRLTGDNTKNKKINAARRWYCASGNAYTVNPIFRLLGAVSVVHLYEEMYRKGFRDPNEREKKKALFLISAVQNVYDGRLFDVAPTIIIIRNNRKNIKPDPLYFARLNSKDKKTRRYVLENIPFKQEELEIANFEEAFLTTAERLFFCYGTIRSNRANLMLTRLAECCVKNSAVLKKLEDEWNAGI